MLHSAIWKPHNNNNSGIFEKHEPPLQNGIWYDVQKASSTPRLRHPKQKITTRITSNSNPKKLNHKTTSHTHTKYTHTHTHTAQEQSEITNRKLLLLLAAVGYKHMGIQSCGWMIVSDFPEPENSRQMEQTRKKRMSNYPCWYGPREHSLTCHKGKPAVRQQDTVLISDFQKNDLQQSFLTAIGTGPGFDSGTTSMRIVKMHTHTLSLWVSLSHTHRFSLSLSHTYTHSPFLTHTHSVSFSLFHTHTHTHTHSPSLIHTLSLSLSHTHTLSLPLKHTHTFSLSLIHTHTLSLPLSHTHTHTHSLSLSLACIQTFSLPSCTHTDTHTLSPSLAHSRTEVKGAHYNFNVKHRKQNTPFHTRTLYLWLEILQQSLHGGELAAQRAHVCLKVQLWDLHQARLTLQHTHTHPPTYTYAVNGHKIKHDW